MNKIEELMEVSYPITLSSPIEVGDGWLSELTDLPGCTGVGDTIEEAIRTVLESKRVWIELAIERGIEVPESSHCAYPKKKMTFEEYKAQENRLEARIEANKQRYIADNKKYDVGDIVKVRTGTKEKIGVVDGNKIRYSGGVCPTIVKLNKNGTKNKNGHTIWEHEMDEITVLKKQRLKGLKEIA